jgi:hypothetical protein
MSGNLNRSKSAMKPYGNVILMTAICIAIFTLFMAPRPAHAQRCPAGQDAFLNCLPLNHQGYRATNEISIRQQEYARSHSGRTGAQRAARGRADAPYLACIRNRTAALIRRGDPRALRSAETTRQRGSAIGTPAFQSMLRENERACGKAR